ncbi:methyltransferase domain-containing protein [Roseateles saccharophilus]|uniref:Malonyl-CoA O-methyltransferase n=1 Tax=Roseateles saccharophilus TaxID=304 RepID=A0A4R3V5X6_ROSSA|nr:methyltransferase domain-containing protein [Roseateles saccharophilus]MDG0833724.1 biotin synthase [Roseateles saccharophilus]TCU98803.1 malonyl-CoA O-methyltransferase [Roseateles saccharophilus]
MSEPVSTPSSNKGSRPQDIDPAASRHQARRLAAAAEPPWLHAEVARRMAERLPFIKLQPARVLDAAPALGASAELLRQAYPGAEMLWHEADPALAERAARARPQGWWQKLRGASSGRVDALPARPEVELLWSNMALHAGADLPALLAGWQASLAVGGFVMFSCLGPDSFRELRPLYTRRGWGRPAPDWWDMHDVGDLVLKAGFADPVMDQERLTLTWASPQALLADLRALGGNLAPARFAGLRGGVWRQQLLAELETLRDADGRLALTVELVYGHAFKAAPRLTVAAQTEVSVDAMRAQLRKARPGA